MAYAKQTLFKRKTKTIRRSKNAKKNARKTINSTKKYKR